MSKDEHLLLERLQRGGYIVSDILPNAEGVTGAIVGQRWMTVSELNALVAQDSELEDKA